MPEPVGAHTPRCRSVEAGTLAMRYRPMKSTAFPPIVGRDDIRAHGLDEWRMENAGDSSET